VCVAAPSRLSVAGASRHARWREVVADAADSPARFVDDVVRAARRRDTRIIVPVTDAALLALLPARKRIGDIELPWPDADVMRRVADKAVVTDLARTVGIAVPAQRVASTVAEALNAAEELRFPLVIKPSRSVREQPGGSLTKLTVAHAADASALRACLADLGPTALPVLLQERIVGPGVGLSLLIWDGRVIAHFAHRRLREHPPSGGVSVYAESIAAAPDLVHQSAALLERLAWRGVAMVEYKVDAATGTPHLMEINGRFWGSLQLAIDAGVDFPALLVRASSGQAEPVTSYRTGVRFRWWWGDVDHLLLRLALSARRLSLPPGAPSRRRVLRDFVNAGPPQRANDVLRREDPWPFAVETFEWLVARAIRAARAGARRVRPVIRGVRARSIATSPLS
jgi:predicted ATP-grasp superfamily ATP-dependent carboligase